MSGECCVITCVFPPSLDSVLLCNKTSSGPGFKKTEIQALNSRVKRLESGECDQLSGEGFTCVEHYECIGEDVTLATTGDSSTQIISILTEVNVEQQLPSYTYNYAFSILDATDKTCQTYTKVPIDYILSTNILPHTYFRCAVDQETDQRETVNLGQTVRRRLMLWI